MASTFFGLNIGTSGMQAYQASLNTTAHNVSNIGTEGYTKQYVRLAANPAISVGSRYGMVGAGVAIKEITQNRDVYYDDKYRYNKAIAGNYNTKEHYLSSIQSHLYSADPANNSKLRDVIAKAKANNMPNDTIDRGIKKAAGDGTGANYENITYEGYGPKGTALIVRTLTDNKNRTASNVRNAFTKGGGNVGTTGCVSFMFDEKGQILIDREECGMEADDIMMVALDAGAEDFNEEEDSFEILTAPADFSVVREALEAENIPMAQAEVTMIPQTTVELTDENDLKMMNRIIDLLDEDDDVQEVFHNAEMPDEE